MDLKDTVELMTSGSGKGWAEVAFPDSKGVGFVSEENLI